MPSNKLPPTAAPPSRPPLGTLIDDDSLELVEVLGIGGYGVVYRAEDTCSPNPKSYAVKCLMHHQLHHSSRQRQVHIREIALHQIASAHPNVVTLHRVVEDNHFTYIIMDYAPDHDLFSQILHSCRYLGDDYLIKHVFMQLLDAVEYCHSLGIYHRDLKPENILCFEDGLRIAITDFGLATTDKLSEEFRTGSIYHMSPECQGGEFAPTGSYSPMFNDIWSLGIILLNLATGRNPWKAASLTDPTFQAYLRDPFNFLPTVLPISQEINAVLVRMLEVDWRERMTLPELRQAMEEITTFYSDGVIFEGSMARCPWEAGMEIDSGASAKESQPVERSEPQDMKSHWSAETASDIVFARRSIADESVYDVTWAEYSSGTTWALEPSNSDDSLDNFGRPKTPADTHSLFSPTTSLQSLPTTPDSAAFGDKTKLPPTRRLKIDTNCSQPRYYANNVSMLSYTTSSSVMHTAIEYDPYSSSFFLASPASPEKGPIQIPVSTVLDISEDKDMLSPSEWRYSAAISLPSKYASMQSSFAQDMLFDQPISPASPPPDTILWPERRVDPPRQFPIREDQEKVSRPRHQSILTNLTNDHLAIPPTRPLSPSKKLFEGLKTTNLFNPIKFFPLSSPPTAAATRKAHASHHDGEMPLSQTFASFTFSQPPIAPTPQAAWVDIQITSPRIDDRAVSPPPVLVAAPAPQRRRSPRHWFLPSKLFASNGRFE